ncbi:MULTISPECIES: hypothetical protein [unclassified Undibacterium]|uniref:hypothetical protein n=1 Tax=unclassified Undibacterium TaxID=2630295 RepID=UPI002AC8A3B0|nr:MULTISPECIES: hypothetical protein [unclassified Undibacterium]MEB0137813.1 hypothetical protein [Undibacterium sp. CCC2.1]MEB0170996.1 hypothetical protein [Undibacterium sp. CCC1.1]MEB0175041.1 hypothetical protein [Undibacterium sp. CCC3.4]MEB0215181.1 hypothetical protein [Undibacterium sp. 5I2]WPX44847.1 hypothetical protein RHM61_06350 [Undibacterium sp. CCC3.4]
MKALLAAILLCLSTLASAAVTRFDSLVFFQSETVLQEKGINKETLGRYSRNLQSNIYRLLKNVTLPPSSGYLVIAMRSDGAVTSWLDMQPKVHEFYDNQIYDIVQKMIPLNINKGIFVFAIKIAIDTPVFTKKPMPEPPDWVAAKKKISNPSDIEELVLSVWPE